jgi:hypothetical protein
VRSGERLVHVPIWTGSIFIARNSGSRTDRRGPSARPRSAAAILIRRRPAAHSRSIDSSRGSVGGSIGPGDSGAPFYVPVGASAYIRGVTIAVSGATMYAEKWSTVASHCNVTIVTN